jgi:2-polyprenyl-6-methoxyphenol hydroxylase-like FAD-dependent oxidoreductase
MPERIVVIGAGVAGLGTALGLGRAGHDVVVVDRDDLSVAPGPDEAFGIERAGAPQVRHTHALLARLTGTLRERFPDVRDTLVRAGGVEVDLTRRFPDRCEGDEQLRVLLARRTTLEWALRRAAAAEPPVTLRGGTAVEGLVGERGSVRGVRLATGEVLTADTVVAAGGRRVGLPAWLADLGVELPEEEHDTGIVYLTRWYRTTDDWDPVIGGEELVKLGGDLGYLFYLAVPADRGMFSLTMAVNAADNELRANLRSPDAFHRAARSLPLPDGLVDRLVPMGPVHPMGALVNRIRRFLTDDGRPRVLGLHAVGDAHTCTNPIYGRGCSLALAQGVALTDIISAHPDDQAARVIAYEAYCREHIEPWYTLSLHSDQARRARAAGTKDGSTAAASIIDQLFALGSDDPVLGRAILRAVNVLATPNQLMADPVVVTRAMELAAANADTSRPPRDSRNRWFRAGLSRDEMVALTAA